MTRVPGTILSGAATAAAVFLLYTNLPVVAYQQGLLPKAAAALVPLLLLAAVVHQVVIRRQPFIVDRTLLAMLAFLSVLVLSTFRAKGYEVAFSHINVFLSEGILIYVLVRNAVRTLPELRVALVAVLLAASLLGGLTILQTATGNYRQDFLGLAQRNVEQLDGAPAAGLQELNASNRARGPVDEPNRFAQILLMVAPLGLVLGLNAFRRRQALLAGGSLLLMLGGVLLTYSRGAFLALLGLLVLCAPLHLIRPRRIVGVVLTCAILTPLVFPGYAARIGSLGGVAGLFGKADVQADGATRGRTTEMLSALAAYLDHPLLGVGPGQYVPYYSVHYQSLPEISIRELTVPRRAHNLYLEVAAETGTLGLVIFMAIPLLLLRDLQGLRRELASWRPDLARLAAGFMLALLAYLGTGVFLHVAFERYYWFLVALTAAAAGILEKESRPVTEPETSYLVPLEVG